MSELCPHHLWESPFLLSASLPHLGPQSYGARFGSNLLPGRSGTGPEKASQNTLGHEKSRSEEYGVTQASVWTGVASLFSF